MSRDGHRPHPTRGLALAVLTVSDTRTPETDESGALMRRMLEAAGHRVLDQGILPDEPDEVRSVVARWLGTPGCDGVLVSGGTGVSARDRTFEALCGLLEKKLDGFGELFRMLSYAQVGSAAMLSRAMGGIAAGRLLFSMPGSPQAVGLAMEKLILPELGHLAAELRKH